MQLADWLASRSRIVKAFAAGISIIETNEVAVLGISHDKVPSMEDLLYLRVHVAFALSNCGGFILMHYSMLVGPNGTAVICCALALCFLNAFARASFIENRRCALYM